MSLEAIVFGLLFAAACVPLVAAARRRWLGVLGSALLVLLVAAPAATAWSWWKSEDVRERLAPEQRPTEVPLDDYVSSDTCRACHPSQYASWHSSYHRTMTQFASPETVVPSFDGVELEAEEGIYRLTRDGSEYWVDMPDPHWREGMGQRLRVKKRIVMLTGSHHQQAFWYPSGNSRVVWILPFMYLIDEQRWIPRGAAFLGPEEKAKKILGVWNNSCIKCHSTRGRPQPDDSGGMDTQVAEIGIACEACHGPAEQHVELHRNPRERYRRHLSDEPDPSIVQPERLSHRASAQVCGQCHGVWRHDGREGWIDWLRQGLTYRPGGDLSEDVLIMRHNADVEEPRIRKFLEKNPSYAMELWFWSDGMVRVSGREYNGLVESPCYQRGELTCVSCHELHRTEDDPRILEEWKNDQLASGMEGDEACLQCHAKYREDPQAHTHHTPDSSGGRCYNCHMPHTTYGLLKAIRSHQVDSPTVYSSVETGRPNACNQCHLNKTLLWSAEYLERWYELLPPDLTEDEQSVAASVLWLLAGDAGQRALMAWSMGWKPAQEASGTDWMTPFLSPLLDDPYQAVRQIAYRSLRSLPGNEDFVYDFLAQPGERREAAGRALDRWRRLPPGAQAADGSAVLIDRRGALMEEIYYPLLSRRDDRDVELHE